MIAGPTGVGKTAAAVALGTRVPVEVVGADSRQVYRFMDRATGKPGPEERRAVAHHLIDIVDPDDRYHAARFRADATTAIAAIRRRGRVPVVVGGTGLYIRALVRGLDPAPPADPAFRRELAVTAAREGCAALWTRLLREAPSVAARLHPNDEVRVVRALEVARAGGVSPGAGVLWRSRPSDYDVLYIGLSGERSALARRLRERAATMVAAGLETEVRVLLERGYDESLPAMQGLGYREFVRVVRGKLTAPEALRLMQRDTVRYAKRQWTWFMREPEVEWLDVTTLGGAEGVAAVIEARMRARGFIA